MSRAPTVAETVALVRAARTRPFTCKSCGIESQMLVPLAGMSRMVVACETCAPGSQTWVRERAERPLRAAIVHLDARVRELEDVVSAFDGVPAIGSAARHRRFGPAGKTALGRAVRCVAHAQGTSATGEALLDVAAVARDWAAILLVRERPVRDAA